jgi:hypothetical protein
MLLGLMEERNVVPVIGPEPLCIAYKENPSAQRYELLGEALAQRKGIEATTSREGIPLLNKIADQLSLSNMQQPGDLEYEIDISIIRVLPLLALTSGTGVSLVRNFCP